MIIKDILDDGTVIKQYEVGDRVKVLYTGDELFLEKGDLAVIESVTPPSNYEVLTDSCKKSGWGEAELAGEHIEPAGVTKVKIPQLIKEWKETQIKKLIGI